MDHRRPLQVGLRHRGRTGRDLRPGGAPAGRVGRRRAPAVMRGGARDAPLAGRADPDRRNAVVIAGDTSAHGTVNRTVTSWNREDEWRRRSPLPPGVAVSQPAACGRQSPTASLSLVLVPSRERILTTGRPYSESSDEARRLDDAEREAHA